MTDQPIADGLSASGYGPNERIKDQLRNAASGSPNRMHAAMLRAALLRIEHLEADLAAEREIRPK